VLSDYGGDLQVVGRLNPDPTPPSIDIFPPFADQARDQDSAGFGDVVGRVILTVRVRVTTVDHDAGQNLLLRFMDEEDDLSLVHAIMDDQTLNGLAGSVYAVGPVGIHPLPRQRRRRRPPRMRMERLADAGLLVTTTTATLIDLTRGHTASACIQMAWKLQRQLSRGYTHNASVLQLGEHADYLA
jgi:hypothetical protein